MKVVTKQDGTVNIGQQKVKEVEEYQYLGCIISKAGSTCENVKAHISKARHAFVLLRPEWHITSLSPKTKLRMFSSNVKSIL